MKETIELIDAQGINLPKGHEMSVPLQQVVGEIQGTGLPLLPFTLANLAASNARVSSIDSSR